MKYTKRVKRRILWGSLLACVVAVITMFSLYTYATEQQILANTQRIETDQAEIQEIARARAIKEAAIEKARQEAAAIEAATLSASLAASGSDAGSTHIDSTACNTTKAYADPTDIRVVVNKQYCIQPLGYEPSNLVTVRGATISAKAQNDFLALYEAAAAAGQGFYVTSSYRSYAEQVATYTYWVSISGQVGADTYSARPGYSEHQTGFAVDVAANGCVLDCFRSTSQYEWLRDNAATYGFIQRYIGGYETITGYSAEEWHYRYVGAATAQDMKQKGIMTLEEYFQITGGGYPQ